MTGDPPTRRLHLDHNAGTVVEPAVLERFVEVQQREPGNPASVHACGRSARAVLESARHDLALALGVGNDQVVLTSGGTEANNLAVLGLGEPGQPVLLAGVEHPSVLRPAERRGIRWWAVSPLAVAEPARPDRPVGLVCLVHGQSEVGSLQPIAAAAAIARELGVPLHVDASQTLGRVPLDEVVRLADSVSLSPHKAGGLRGCGVLVTREPSRLRPLLLGGAQEHGLRPGTQSPALAAATALAVRLAIEQQPARAAAMRRSRDAFAAELAAVDHIRLTPENALPNTLAVRFPGIDGRNLVPALDMAGIEASQGSACSSGSPTPPRVFSAMGLADEPARQCVRFSVSHRTSIADAARAARTVAAVVARLRETGAMGGIRGSSWSESGA